MTAKFADYGVEGCVCERQVVRVRATELKPRVSASGSRDHRLRDIDAHH